MKSICSPFILLQTIIDQSRNLNIKEAIIVVLKRYQFYDSNLPQILDKFFPETPRKSNDKYDELCYIGSLKQEASEDKVFFDSA
jgi:hypothetical protein